MLCLFRAPRGKTLQNCTIVRNYFKHEQNTIGGVSCPLTATLGALSFSSIIVISGVVFCSVAEIGRRDNSMSMRRFSG